MPPKPDDGPIERTAKNIEDELLRLTYALLGSGHDCLSACARRGTTLWDRDWKRVQRRTVPRSRHQRPDGV
jgi:hypothetical protein